MWENRSWELRPLRESDNAARQGELMGESDARFAAAKLLDRRFLEHPHLHGKNNAAGDFLCPSRNANARVNETIHHTHACAQGRRTTQNNLPVFNVPAETKQLSRDPSMWLAVRECAHLSIGWAQKLAQSRSCPRPRLAYRNKFEWLQGPATIRIV
jgi:hypothetical protein